MKNTVILALVCIGLGFAAGWIAKPATKAREAAVINPRSDSPEPRRNSGRFDSPETLSDRNKPALTSFSIGPDGKPQELDAESQKALTDTQSKWAEMLKKRQMARADARIAKLAAELNLTPTQQNELRKLLEAKFEGMESMLAGGTDASKNDDLASLLNGGVDSFLAGLLTPEQEAAHDALQKRELANQIEAKALKALAKLSFLDLSQEQKDAAYDILYTDAEKSAGTPSAENAMVSVMTEGMGIDLDLEDLGISEAFKMEATGEPGEQPNPAEMMAKMKESRAKRVDEKVEALRPVLNETQLDAYRKNLESQSGSILGGMFGGFGDDNPE